MTSRKTPCAVLIVAWFGAELHAQEPVSAPRPPRYPGIRTQFNQSLSQALTNEQRLQVYREAVAQGRYSGRPLLRRMFGNFGPGLFHLSPTTPGLSTTVRLLASDNRNVVFGHARTIRYANNLQGDGRFRVLSLNQKRLNYLGQTDADIHFQHSRTGLRGRIEVKNVKPRNQLANIETFRRQILQMAEDARLTGEVQVLGSRYELRPEIRAFAERRGILVRDRLRTGDFRVLPEDLRFTDFATNLDKRFRMQARLNALAGSAQLGMGAYLAYQAIRQLEDDVANFGGTRGDWLRAGEHGATLLAGAGFGTAGIAQLARQIPALANSSRLVSLSKWGGRLGIAGTILTEGFLVHQYLSGDLTERQFWHGQASLGGGLAAGAAGGVSGYWIGGALGGGVGFLVGGPFGAGVGFAISSKVGAIGGGIGAGYAGAHFAGRGVEGLHRLQDSEQQNRYVQFLLRHYQSPEGLSSGGPSQR